MSNDPYDLDRFVQAQDRVADAVTNELSAGRKRSHWMWFVFPQVRGLGSSATAQRYAIESLAAAVAFLRHPILGERLREWTKLVLDVDGRSAEEIFGYPDYLKFRSSMTLFDAAARQEEGGRGDPAGATLFRRALDKYYGGNADEKTLRTLNLS